MEAGAFLRGLERVLLNANALGVAPVQLRIMLAVWLSPEGLSGAEVAERAGTCVSSVQCSSFVIGERVKGNRNFSKYRLTVQGERVLAGVLKGWRNGS